MKLFDWLSTIQWNEVATIATTIGVIFSVLGLMLILRHLHGLLIQKLPSHMLDISYTLFFHFLVEKSFSNAYRCCL